MRYVIPVLLLAAAGLAAQEPVRVRVDATDAPRRVFHAHITMPAKAGSMTLLYPEWIPGEHGPTGPVVNLMGLKIQSGGKTIPWRRDDVNMYAIHVDVPAGATSLDITFDFISPPETEDFTAGASATSELAVLNWNQVLLYPKGADADTIQYQAELRVPPGWRYGTALPMARESGDEVEFQPSSLTTLIDSPLSMAVHYRTIDLGSAGGVPHFLNLAADSDRALEVSQEVADQYKDLVKEALALFGTQHFRDYHFLYTLSDHVQAMGLEHHESSDDRDRERTLIDPEMQRRSADLLAHEYVHSWNGKYRRPSGLVSSDSRDGGYDTPMKGRLLWVYEGLTQYLGGVLARRSGLWSAEDYREMLAATAAQMDNRYGRRWRPLEDTAVAAQVLYGAGPDYENYRRSVDFYPEGVLIWLEADVTIRQVSKGAKSLDDFCRAFYGGPVPSAPGAPAMKPYKLDDLIAALNTVQPYDWADFFHARVNRITDRAPLGGVERAGWKLVYNGKRSPYLKAVEDAGLEKFLDLMYSIGMRIKDDGTVLDVRYEGPAQKAGIAPATKIVAVNGREFNPTAMREAVAATATNARPLELLIKTGEYYETHGIDYHGGERYPHLERDPSLPDLLSDIVKPKTRP